MTSPIESYDLSIPSLGIYATLTKVPCGQWVHDWGTSGIMRLTYFGQQNLAGVQRWNIRMVSDNKSWVVAKNDVDGNWLDGNDQPLEVTLVPTMWNLLKRVAALEESTYANVNAAIASMKDTRAELTQKVAHVEDQRKNHEGFVLKLVETQSQECLQAVNGVKKVDEIEKIVDELAESVRSMNEHLSRDTIGNLSTRTDALAQRVDTKLEQLVAEVDGMKEKMHYALVKKEQDQTSDDNLEQIELLRHTIGSCLLRNEELGTACSRLTNDVCLLRKELGKVTRAPKEIVDLCASAEVLEPGELRECSCKRPRS